MTNTSPGDAVWLQALDFNQQLAAAKQEHTQEMRNIILSFLEVLDSFDRCFAAIDRTGQTSPVAQSWLKSFDQVCCQLQKTLERAGVSFMNCQGEPFDPHKHNAVQVQSKPGVEDGIVIEVITRGCEWREEILRQAKVVVSRDNR